MSGVSLGKASRCFPGGILQDLVPRAVVQPWYATMVCTLLDLHKRLAEEGAPAPVLNGLQAQAARFAKYGVVILPYGADEDQLMAEDLIRHEAATAVDRALHLARVKQAERMRSQQA